MNPKQISYPPVRIGIIGCGNVMRDSYMALAEQLACREQVKIICACDIDPAKKEMVKERFGIDSFSTDYRDIITREDVDLVLILTSMQEHFEITKAALNAGKHVLVEKPMATNLAEAQELLALAKTSPGHLLPAPHIILSPTFGAIWGRIQRGDIGKVYLARAMYGWSGPDWGEWFYRPGGGSLFDLGVYNVISLTGLLGPAKRVTAMVGTAIPERVVNGKTMAVQVDDNAHVLLDFGDSVFAVVTTGFTIQKYRNPAIELYGAKGTIQMMGDDWDPDGYEMWQNDSSSWQVFGETDANWPWTDGLRHFVECIQQGTTPMVTPEHHYHALEIMIKAMEAGKDGQARLIESTFTPLRLSLEDIDPVAAHRVHIRGHKNEL